MSERELTEKELRGKALDRLLDLRRAELYLRGGELRKLAAGDYGAMTTAALRATERLLVERSRELRLGGNLAVDDYPTPQFLAGAEEGMAEVAKVALMRADYRALDALIPALVQVVADQEARNVGEEDEGDTVDLDEVDEEEPPPPEEPEVSVDTDPQGIDDAPADPGRIDLPAPPSIPAPAVAHEQPPLRTAVGPASVPGLIRNAPPPTR